MNRPTSSYDDSTSGSVVSDQSRPATTVAPERPASLRTAKFVFIRREFTKSPLQTPYHGPYEVLRRSDKYFTVKVGTRDENVSIDRLKAAFIDNAEPVTVAQPPRRGRPPLDPDPRPPEPPPPAQETPQQGHPEPQRPPEPPRIQQRLPDPLPQRMTYAEATTRAGRTTKLPVRYRE